MAGGTKKIAASELNNNNDNFIYPAKMNQLVLKDKNMLVLIHVQH